MKERKQPSVIVVPDSAEKGKYKIMVNYIQRGPSYSSEELANKEKAALIESGLLW